MPTKAELYAQMADKVATQLTGELAGMGRVSHYCFPPLQVPVP